MSRALEAAVLLLLESQGDLSFRDVLVFYKDVATGLTKGLEHKRRQPAKEKTVSFTTTCLPGWVYFITGLP